MLQLSSSSHDSMEYIPAIINAYGAWVEEWITNGWNGYLISIVFHDLAGAQTVKIDQMRQAATKMYTRLVTRMVRNPRSEQWRPFLPKAIFSTDLPIRKDGKRSVDDAIANNGLHMHGIILAHPNARVTDLEEHFWTNRGVYKIDGIRNIGVERIDYSPGYVTDYALKGVKRLELDVDDILVLPRVLNELPGRSQPAPGNRHIKDLQSAFNFSDELAREICANEPKPRCETQARKLTGR
jgi:hypothetical protein